MKTRDRIQAHPRNSQWRIQCFSVFACASISVAAFAQCVSNGLVPCTKFTSITPEWVICSWSGTVLITGRYFFNDGLGRKQGCVGSASGQAFCSNQIWPLVNCSWVRTYTGTSCPGTTPIPAPVAMSECCHTTTMPNGTDCTGSAE